jgi:hypothetical protein
MERLREIAEPLFWRDCLVTVVKKVLELTLQDASCSSSMSWWEHTQRDDHPVEQRLDSPVSVASAFCGRRVK